MISYKEMLCWMIVAVFLVLFTTGCEEAVSPRVKEAKETDSMTNVREVDKHYMMYELENGYVTCRERLGRHGLACWRNEKE